ncbi:MAG: toll/interleukin-1 receptor domain-containing protein [Ktedonobacteraceae bacterium]
MALRIFLSHSHEDNDWCDDFVKELRKYDVDIWYDRESLEVSKRWIPTIEKGIANSDIFLIIITPDSWNSDFVQMERELALKQKKQTIAIYLKEIEIDGFITLIQMMNCVGKDAVEVATLLVQLFKLTIMQQPQNVLEDKEIQPSNFPSVSQSREKDGQKLQNVSVLEPGTLSEDLPSRIAENEKLTIADGNRHPFRNSILRHRKPLISSVIVLILIVSLVPFIPFPACIGTFCRSPQHSTSQQSGAARTLSFSLVDVVSPSFVLPDNPQSYTTGSTLPTSTGAVLLAKNTSSYYKIIVDVRNLRSTGVNILIDYIALKIQQIPAVPRPLRVWTQGVATTYNTYPYPVTYEGQTPGQPLYAAPPQNVTLKHGEDNQISIQISSAVTAYLQFQVQVAYQISTATTTTVLTLPQTFQVVFSDASNWQQYVLQNGSFVEKS